MTIPSTRAELGLGNLTILLILITAITCAATGISLAQEKTAQVTPLNAHSAPYGTGWECNHGYRFDGSGCTKMSKPDNAHYNGSLYGEGWDCDRGFRRSHRSCAAITIPENAYLNSSGVRWECERGYKRSLGGCELVRAPANGHLTGYSHSTGWKCNRGYRQSRDACEQVRIPANAHLDYTGSDWECDPPFKKRSGRCVLPQ